MTPTEHVATLDKLAKHYEDAVKHFTRNGVGPETGIVKLYRTRADAIRWILAETAHPCDPSELVV